MVRSKAIRAEAPVTNSQVTSPKVATVAVRLPMTTLPKKGVSVLEYRIPSQRNMSPSDTSCWTYETYVVYQNVLLSMPCTLKDLLKVPRVSILQMHKTASSRRWRGQLRCFRQKWPHRLLYSSSLRSFESMTRVEFQDIPCKFMVLYSSLVSLWNFFIAQMKLIKAMHGEACHTCAQGRF